MCQRSRRFISFWNFSPCCWASSTALNFLVLSGAHSILPTKWTVLKLNNCVDRTWIVRKKFWAKFWCVTFNLEYCGLRSNWRRMITLVSRVPRRRRSLPRSVSSTPSWSPEPWTTKSRPTSSSSRLEPARVTPVFKLAGLVISELGSLLWGSEFSFSNFLN